VSLSDGLDSSHGNLNEKPAVISESLERILKISNNTERASPNEYQSFESIYKIRKNNLYCDNKSTESSEIKETNLSSVKNTASVNNVDKNMHDKQCEVEKLLELSLEQSSELEESIEQSSEQGESLEHLSEQSLEQSSEQGESSEQSSEQGESLEHSSEQSLKGSLERTLEQSITYVEKDYQSSNDLK
jgi:hypothetical protein